MKRRYSGLQVYPTLILVIVLFYQMNTIGQELDETFLQTNGTVNTIVRNGNDLFIGGNFTVVGPSVPNFASLDVITGIPDLSLPKVYGVATPTVNVIISDGAGGWYIGGNFTQVGDSARNYLAHIQSDNTVGSWNPNADGAVQTMTLLNNVIYIGGSFTHLGGLERNYVAAVDIDGNVTSWSPVLSLGFPIYALASSGDIIYLGGGFTTVNGEARNRLAAVNTSGNLLPWNPGANSIVRAMAIHDTVIYVGGLFTQVGGVTRNRVAAIGISGSLINDWLANANSPVYSIVVSHNTIYVAGQFSNINGLLRNKAAALQVDGTLLDWNPTSTLSIGTAYAIKRVNDIIFIGGTQLMVALDTVDGNQISWDAGLALAAVSPQPTVYSLASNGSNIFIGGTFNIAGGKSRTRIAAIDLTNKSLLPFNVIMPSGTVSAMGINNDTLFFGGNFSVVNGETRNRLAAVDINTGILNGWNPNAGGAVSGITMDENSIFVSGSFTTIAGVTRNRVAEIGFNGLLTDWNVVPNNFVTDVKIDNNIIYLGGTFSSINGSSRNGIAAVDRNGNLLAWNPDIAGSVYSMVIKDNIVFVGGQFTTISGQQRDNFGAVDLNGNLLPLIANTNSWINRLWTASNNLYFGGAFATIGDSSRSYLGSIDISTGQVTSWNPLINNQVSDISTSDDYVFIGGQFTYVNNKFRNYFAAITDPSLSNPTTFQLTVNIEDEWNIVSIPGLHPVNQGVDTWWSGRNPSTFVFGYDEGYYPVTEVEPGIGYWMEHIGANTYNTGDEWPAGGINIVPNASIGGNEGWNLIGGYHYDVPVSGITTTPSGLQTGMVWGYSSTSGYQAADDLIPGNGYWIELTGAGDINLPDATFKSSGKFSERIGENWGRIIITDRTGKSYTLYGVNGDVNLNEYNLPPMPPSGRFDVRYKSGRIAEYLNAGEQIIEMSGVGYPVTVKVENMSARIQDTSGEIVDVELRAGEQVVVNNSAVDKLVVLGGEISLPIEYALEQNYPNPFNPSTVIKFSLPEAAKLSLTVFNVLGQKVSELINTKLEAGRYSYQWDASNLSSGIYLYQLKTDNFVSIKKMMLIK